LFSQQLKIVIFKAEYLFGKILKQYTKKLLLIKDKLAFINITSQYQ